MKAINQKGQKSMQKPDKESEHCMTYIHSLIQNNFKHLLTVNLNNTKSVYSCQYRNTRYLVGDTREGLQVH